MHVFPGGGVDRRDAAEDVPWAGPGPAEWARRLGTDEDTARMLVTAALREVFEESGVLLAGPTPDSVLEDVRGEVWSSRRAALVDRELSFAEVLAHEGLVLRGDLLSYRAHWVTPEFEARRYDTWFFAATVPHGQDADDATSEAETAGWVRPDEALRQGSSGEVFSPSSPSRVPWGVSCRRSSRHPRGSSSGQSCRERRPASSLGRAR
jgi:8-oxo-dGTP pyrophosphatase MutT (NUDIX family)